MREHHVVLFLGNGVASKVQVYELEIRLRAAFSNLSALQQGLGGRHGDRPTADDLVEEINDVVCDIAMALTGRTIEL